MIITNLIISISWMPLKIIIVKVSIIIVKMVLYSQNILHLIIIIVLS